MGNMRRRRILQGKLSASPTELSIAEDLQWYNKFQLFFDVSSGFCTNH